MQNMPPAAVYLRELEFMPWGRLIVEVRNYIAHQVPQDGSLLDMLCGPGYLLGELEKQRPDISYQGVDLEPEYLEYARYWHPNITFHVADAFTWSSREKFDAVICTAGVHHLPDAQQERFIGKLASLVAPGGFCIVADPYIDDYSSQEERIKVAARFGYEYLAATIESGAPPEVIDAAIECLRNDVFQTEWKTSVKKRLAMFKPYFKRIYKRKTWPLGQREYESWGDYYFMLRND